MCRSAGGMSRVVPLADFALIRRFAPPSPPGGRLLRQSLVVRDSADFLVRLRSTTKQIRTAEGSLPPGGEGGTPVPDEGEIGERSTKRHAHPFSPSSKPFSHSFHRVFHRLWRSCGKGWKTGVEKNGKTENRCAFRDFPCEKIPFRGCGKLCGKGVKLPVFPGGQRFSTATRQTVFRCGKRFSAMRAMSCQIRRPRPAPAENSTFCPPFSNGFANGFPSENLRPHAENASIDAEIRVFPFFHTLHTPYYDYYDFILSILSSFLSPAQARASQNKSHHPIVIRHIEIPRLSKSS